MNLPNKLSIVRIALIPVFVTLFFLPFNYVRFAALGVFIVASLTDFLDGYIARKYNMITKVGNFLDTIADKMLIVAALVVVTVSLVPYIFVASYKDFYTILPVPPPPSVLVPLVNTSLGMFLFIITVVCTIIIICRELFISGLKMIAQTKRVSISADKLGKYKMVLQIAALCVLIPLFDIHRIHYRAGEIFLLIGVVALVLATLLTIISAINYLVKYRYVFSEDEKTEEKIDNEEAE